MDKFKILVKTGDQEHAGTDANVKLVIEDDNGLKCPPLKLDLPLHDDLERGTLDIYSQVIPATFGKTRKIYLTRDTKGRSDDWFCDYIIVQDPRGCEKKSYRKVKNLKNPSTILKTHRGFKAETYFPICRWVRAKHTYEFDEQLSTCLPAQDPCKDIRKADIEEKRKNYKYTQNIKNGPAQASVLPSDEKFSDEYFWTFVTDKAKLKAKTTWIKWTNSQWKSFAALEGVYKNSLGEPESIHRWKSDDWFAWQRIQGVNPLVLSLCKEIPKNLDVTESTVEGLLGDVKLYDAVTQNKIFICNLELLDGVDCKDGRELAAPMALFYLNGRKLSPIAIQLKQQKGPSNPVFTPKDPPNTWLLAKMFYNNAEAQHHQGSTHLGLTHLLMEGICICSHRNLSPSHPMFKLMAPHFLFLIAINARGLEKLISPKGWVDSCMTVGVEGIYEVIRRGLKNHNFYNYGNVAKELESRGVLDPKILPYYPYRDDAISLFEIIRNYVEKIVMHHYDTQEKLDNDWELKEWRQELSLLRENGGVGLVGVPGDNTRGFSMVEEVVETISIIISTCSLGHAAANFQQYCQYSYIPNYPGLLLCNPPTEKKEYTDADLVKLLPDMKTTLETILITKLLSSQGTNVLGKFEMQYLYHPTDVAAADEFRDELAKLSFDIKKRNIDRKKESIEFPWLDPDGVPNAISI